MRIAIIGAGNIGGTLTRRLTALDHDVTVANSRGPASLVPLVRETGWVYLKANRVPRKISEMIRVLDELLPKMGWAGTN